MKENEILLRQLFHKYATKYDKKYGTWSFLEFPIENTFLCMDTWNGHLQYKTGSLNYNYWTGFVGDVVFDFGGNEQWHPRKPLQPDNVIDWFIKKIRNYYDTEKE